LAAARNNSSPAAKEFKEYNIVSHNCEHFVKWCAYGVRKSDQVNFKNVFKTIMKSSLYKIQFSQSCNSNKCQICALFSFFSNFFTENKIYVFVKKNVL
jgi:hypothetical protein